MVYFSSILLKRSWKQTFFISLGLGLSHPLATSHGNSTELEKLRQPTGKRMTGSEWATPVRPCHQRERLKDQWSMIHAKDLPCTWIKLRWHEFRSCSGQQHEIQHVHSKQHVTSAVGPCCGQGDPWQVQNVGPARRPRRRHLRQLCGYASRDMVLAQQDWIDNRHGLKCYRIYIIYIYNFSCWTIVASLATQNSLQFCLLSISSCCMMLPNAPKVTDGHRSVKRLSELLCTQKVTTALQ